MTPRERLKTVLRGERPDRVPVAPDFSNMIPARLTGKPFWDLYLYNDPPIWEAYIECARRFAIDALMDGYFRYRWPGDPADPRPWERFIVYRDAGRIVTQASYRENGRRIWQDRVDVFYIADPPTHGVRPERIGLPAVPERFEPVEGVQSVDHGIAGLRRVKRLLGDQGLVGVFFTSTVIVGNEEQLFHYEDHPEALEALKERRLEEVERRFAALTAMAPEDRPDFLCVGGSGTLVLQTPGFFRAHVFPAVRRAIELASSAGIPTHVHSCGPERELVRIFAEETDLTVIDPLETPPKGDCNLADLKRRYGGRMVLKGNLHTTDVMLRGTPEDVARAARGAIADAAAGGRFILSTGDQCGRDTPDENLHALVAAAREFGRY